MTIKRLAVLLPFSPPEISGIANTLSDKIRFWESAVDELRVFTLAASGAAQNPLLTGHNFKRVEGRSLQHAFRAAVPLIQEYQPDALYARYSVPFLGYRQFLSTVPTVLEIHSADLVEYRSQNRKLWIPAVLNRWGVLAGAAGHVYVNDSAANHWSNMVFKRPRRIISNGISLEGVGSSLDPAGVDRLRVVMTIGAPTVWQGVDKFVEFAREFPEHDFLMVTADVNDTADDPPNLERVPPMPRPQLMALLNSCHVGVGTLALYRSSRDEVSSLKVREYLACGLSVVLAHQDTESRVNDLSQVLTIPNNADAVKQSKGAIATFFEKIQQGEVDRESVEFISTAAKETERLAFIASLAGGRTDG